MNNQGAFAQLAHDPALRVLQGSILYEHGVSTLRHVFDFDLYRVAGRSAKELIGINHIYKKVLKPIPPVTIQDHSNVVGSLQFVYHSEAFRAAVRYQHNVDI